MDVPVLPDLEELTSDLSSLENLLKGMDYRDEWRGRARELCLLAWLDDDDD